MKTNNQNSNKPSAGTPPLSQVTVGPHPVKFYHPAFNRCIGLLLQDAFPGITPTVADMDRLYRHFRAGNTHSGFTMERVRVWLAYRKENPGVASAHCTFTEFSKSWPKFNDEARRYRLRSVLEDHLAFQAQEDFPAIVSQLLDRAPDELAGVDLADLLADAPNDGCCPDLVLMRFLVAHQNGLDIQPLKTSYGERLYEFLLNNVHFYRGLLDHNYPVNDWIALDEVMREKLQGAWSDYHMRKLRAAAVVQRWGLRPDDL